MARRLVIIGGDAAGMSAATQARRMSSRDELEIVTLERSSRTSYAACGLPCLVGGLVSIPDRLIVRTPEQHRAKGIDVLATALWNDMTVAEIGGMDLSYAPPFLPVWDPVLLAAGKVASAI